MLQVSSAGCDSTAPQLTASSQEEHSVEGNCTHRPGGTQCGG